ncbi:MAG: winged helix-turn-helix transcriptional regulator [Clostridia bacterium]|nr:winged helix-turn-helix transcriptional regulator [Clostridia bacterium]
MTKRENEILEMIQNNPMISQKEIAEKLNITRSSVGVHIASLISQGFIAGKGYVVNEGFFVTVVGGSNMDILGKPSVPMKGNDSTPGTISYSEGGVGRNIAENLAKLSAPVKLLSVVGKDSNGERILNSGMRSGIDMSRVKVVEGMSTSTYLSVLNHEGEVLNALSDMDIVSEINSGYILECMGLMNRSKLVCVDTNLEPTVLELVFNQCQAPIFIDTVSSAKCTKILGFEDKIFLLKPNVIETEKLLNMTIKSEADILSAMAQFLEKGIKNIIITAGTDGVYFADARGMWHAQAEKAEIVNSNGAGDAFMSGLLYGFLNGESLEEACVTGYNASLITLKSASTINPALSDKVLEEQKSKQEVKLRKLRGEK